MRFNPHRGPCTDSVMVQLPVSDWLIRSSRGDAGGVGLAVRRRDKMEELKETRSEGRGTKGVRAKSTRC